MINVYTGFKYIGEQIGLLEKKGEEERFALGFEESYGYLTGTYVRDKDAVVAAVAVCEMAAELLKHGKHVTWSSTRISLKKLIVLRTCTVFCKIYK